jgi:hypothetical protein
MNINCIKCSAENSFLNRRNNDRRCRSCNHQFVFEPGEAISPTTTSKIDNQSLLSVMLNDVRWFTEPTDNVFENTINELSAYNTLFFTQSQFIYCLDKRIPREDYSMGLDIFARFICVTLVANVLGVILARASLQYQFSGVILSFGGLIMWILYARATSKILSDRERRISARRLRTFGFIMLITIIPTSLIIHSYIVFVIAVLMGISSIHLGNRQFSGPINHGLFIDPDRMQSWLQRWRNVNGDLVQLLPPSNMQTRASAMNQSITISSFGRLVVCQSAELAQMLIANNFHFKSNCGIISIDDSPEAILMLRRNTNLNVYLFHDCSPQGMSMLHQVKNSDRWFKDSNVEIVDIGLTPRQVMTSKHVFLQTSVKSAEIAKRVPDSEWIGLKKYEISWLKSGNYIELASFTPQQSIQILNFGIAGNRNPLDEIDFDSI